MWCGNRFRNVFLGVCLSSALAACAIANDANISCGKPKKDGIVTVTIIVENADGKKESVSWNASIDSGDSAEEKAEKIRAAAPPNDPRVSVGGTSNAVTGTSKDGYTIKSMDFTLDQTNEKHTHNCFAISFEDHRGLMSLTGFSDGFDPEGNPGYVSVQTGTAEAFVPTFPGMPAEEIEAQLIAQLNGGGVPARWVDPSDRLGEEFPGLEGDGSMAWIEAIGFDGLTVDVKDGGLAVDVSGLIDLSHGSQPCLQLSVDRLVAGQRSTFEVAGGTEGERVALVYGMQHGTTAVSNYNGYCATFGIKGVNANRLVGSVKTSGGVALIQRTIPGDTSGVSVLFQAAQQNTCPNECVSNLLEATIQ